MAADSFLGSATNTAPPEGSLTTWLVITTATLNSSDSCMRQQCVSMWNLRAHATVRDNQHSCIHRFQFKAAHSPTAIVQILSSSNYG